MAQTGYTPILIYSSSTTTNAPAAGSLTNSTLGSELAINITDGKLFYKDNANNVQVIAWKVTPTTAGGTGLTSYSQGDLLYYNSGTTLTALAKNTSATRYLSNTGSNNNPAWAQIDLANGVTGTLPVTNGGTGTATAFTAGSVVFAGSSGVYSQNNASFFWDNSNTRLGLGTATPAYNFELAIGSTGQQSLVNFRTANATAANNAGIQIFATPSATAASRSVSLTWDADGADSSGGDYFLIAKNGNSGTVDLFQYSNASMRFGANYTGRVTVDMTLFASGGVSIGNTTDPGATNLSVSGNVVIATSGKGIDFSATAGTGTSELLADYEEGDWTPVVRVGSATGTQVTTSVTTAKYTKIGRYVRLEGFITRNDATAHTGDLYMTGMPFNGYTNEAQIGGGAWFDNSPSTDIRSFSYTNGTSILFPIVGVSDNFVTVQSWDNNRYIYFSIDYMT